MSHNCPNCGTALDLRFRHIKMLTCETCGTSLFLENNQFLAAGESGVMHSAPLLFGLGDDVVIGGQRFLPVGHARFSYGTGWWDEFWVRTDIGGGAWLSLDEGDVVLQTPIEGKDRPKLHSDRLFATFTFGDEKYTITERDKAECVAIAGAFPEVMRVGETYRFVNATNQHGDLLSGEFWEGNAAWFTGRWIDPFDVRVAK